MDEELPNQFPRFRIPAKIVTTAANRLKSRRDWMSYGLMKLSPGIRSAITGTISFHHEKLRMMYMVKMKMMG